MYYRKVHKCPWIDEQDVKVSMSRRQCPLILLFSSWMHRLTFSILNGKGKRKDIWSSCTRPSTFDLSFILVCLTGWQALLWYGSVTYSEINTLASEGASFSSDVVDSADFVPRLSYVVDSADFVPKLSDVVDSADFVPKLSDVVDSADFVPKLSNVERGQCLDGWPADTFHLVAAVGLWASEWLVSLSSCVDDQALRAWTGSWPISRVALRCSVWGSTG